MKAWSTSHRYSFIAEDLHTTGIKLFYINTLTSTKTEPTTTKGKDFWVTLSLRMLGRNMTCKTPWSISHVILECGAHVRHTTSASPSLPLQHLHMLFAILPVLVMKTWLLSSSKSSIMSWKQREKRKTWPCKLRKLQKGSEPSQQSFWKPVLLPQKADQI